MQPKAPWYARPQLPRPAPAGTASAPPSRLDKGDRTLLVGASAFREAERAGLAPATISKRNYHIELFLEILEEREDSLPFYPNHLKPITSFLANAERSNLDSFRSHVWDWLHSPPRTRESLRHLDCSSWSVRRRNAELAEKRLMGAELGSITSHCVRVERDCVRITSGHEPHKTNPPLEEDLAKKWQGFTYREQGALAFAASLGVRDDTLTGIVAGDLLCRPALPPNGTTSGTLKVHIRKDKLRNVERRVLELGCGCTLRPGLPDCALCVLHSPAAQQFAFPISRSETTKMNKKLGTSGHCWRRALALAMRKHCEDDPLLLNADRVNHHFGWTDPGRHADYALDLRKWEDFRPIDASRSIVNTCTRHDAEQISDWKWYDPARTTGVQKAILHSYGVPGGGGKPSAATGLGNTASGASRIHIPLKRTTYEPDAKKRLGTMVVQARPPPRPPTCACPRCMWSHTPGLCTCSGCICGTCDSGCNQAACTCGCPPLSPAAAALASATRAANAAPLAPRGRSPIASSPRDPRAKKRPSLARLPSAKRPRTSEAAPDRVPASGPRADKQQYFKGSPLDSDWLYYPPETEVDRQRLDVQSARENMRDVPPSSSRPPDNLVSARIVDGQHPGELRVFTVQDPVGTGDDAKQVLRGIGICPEAGWTVSVRNKFDRAAKHYWEVRAKCKRCPTVQKDKTCGMTFMSYIYDGSTSISVKLNDGDHSLAALRGQKWPDPAARQTAPPVAPLSGQKWLASLNAPSRRH